MDQMSSSPLQEILIADPHPLFRDAIHARLKAWYPQSRIRQVANATEVLDTCSDSCPDLIICELNLAPGDAFQIFDEWPGKQPPLVIIFTRYNEPKLVRDICKRGAYGYVLKTSPAEDLHTAIEAALRRDVYLGPGVSPTGKTPHRSSGAAEKFRDYFKVRFELTKRELEVLGQIMRGLSNREIAHQLFISEQTVSVHRKNILRKVGVNNTQKLLRIAYEQRLTKAAG